MSAYIPVIVTLACRSPTTSRATRSPPEHLSSRACFRGFPEIKEALIPTRCMRRSCSPMASPVRAQGVSGGRLFNLGHVMDRPGRPQRRPCSLLARSARTDNLHSQPLLGRASIVFRALAANVMNAQKDLAMVELAAAGCRRCLGRERHRTPFPWARAVPSVQAREIGGFGRVSFTPGSTSGPTTSPAFLVGASGLDRSSSRAVQSWSMGSPGRDCGVDERSAPQRPSPSRRRFR